MSVESLYTCVESYLVGALLTLLGIIVPGCIWGAAEYTDHLMWKYGRPYTEKDFEKNPKLKGFILFRPFRPWYGKRYLKKNGMKPPYYERFKFFLWQTRILYGLFYLFYIATFFYIFVAAQYDEETAYIMMDDFQFAGWTILAGACLISILTLIPFGYIRVNVLNFLAGRTRSREDFWRT